jgi:hypothetical protein
MTQPVVARERIKCPLDLPDASAPTERPRPSPLETEVPSALEAALDAVDHFRVLPTIVHAPVTIPNADVQRRLEAHRLAMMATVHTAEGDVSFPIPFEIGAPPPPVGPDQASDHEALLRCLDQCGFTGATRTALLHGRGTPAEIQRIAQSLLDAGRLPQRAGVPLVQRVREMLDNVHIGIDCAGYTQQAYLAMARTTRAAAGFDSSLHESLASLPSQGFTRVRSVAALRPGDIVSLGPPPGEQFGHRAIVYDQHRASESDLQDFKGAYDAVAPGFAQGEIYVVEVDSSWGGSGNSDLGGVERRMWWYNATTDQWAWQVERSDCPGVLTVQTGPDAYSHPLIGFFRGPGAGATAVR